MSPSQLVLNGVELLGHVVERTGERTAAATLYWRTIHPHQPGVIRLHPLGQRQLHRHTHPRHRPTPGQQLLPHRRLGCGRNRSRFSRPAPACFAPTPIIGLTSDAGSPVQRPGHPGMAHAREPVRYPTQPVASGHPVTPWPGGQLVDGYGDAGTGAAANRPTHYHFWLQPDQPSSAFYVASR